MRALNLALVMSLLAHCALLAVADSGIPVSLQLQADGTALELKNGYVRLVFNLMRGSLDVVQGRFEGDGLFVDPLTYAASPALSPPVPPAVSFTPAALRQGAVAIVVTGNGVGYQETSTSSFIRATALQPTIVSNTSAAACFNVTLTDGPAATARVSSTFSFALTAASRSFTFGVTTQALQPFNTSVIRLATSWTTASVVMQYNIGVRQGMDMESPFIGSTQPWQRFYALGYAGAIEIRPMGTSGTTPTVLFAGGWNGQRSGLDAVLAGSTAVDEWMDGFEGSPAIAVAQGTLFQPLTFSITPNNYEFPSSLVSTVAPNLPVDDMRAILTSVYGSTYGALHSYDFSPESRIAPCINYRGDVCYGGLYNFFDPDSFLSISAMLYTFDPAVHAEARTLLETNALYFCTAETPVSCEPGQAIHHFTPNCDFDPSCYCTNSPLHPLVQDCVTFQAISGAIQTGPNIFWTLSALRYAAISGNYTWLNQYAPTIRNSMSFLVRRFDSNVGLFNVPGSLWIDTFIRANYTSDTNAGMVMLLSAMADAETFLGNTTGAAFYLNMSTTVKSSMNKYLWAASDDHFCTNSNPTSGGGVNICARDFVDYDSNLLAVAAGVATGAQAQAILNRIDRGQCTHVRATWVSEVFYNGANCNGGNIGDSAVSMGRIGWADALARQAMGDAANAAIFTNTLLAPLQYELLANTWMYERYTCQGTPTHNQYYIEMGEVVSMMLFEVKYGIAFTFENVVVNPIMGVDAFDFALGAVSLGYTHTSFTASLPFSGTKTFSIHSMTPGPYLINPGNKPAAVGASGVLTFTAQTTGGTTITATLNS